MKKRALVLAAFLFSVYLPAFSIELSLEENKAESGTVGYVDIEKVFKMYPLTRVSKDKFKEKIKEKQKLLDQKSAEIEEMKGRVTRLKQEKEFAESLKNMLDTAQKASEMNAAAKASQEGLPALSESIAVSTIAAAVSSSTVQEIAVSTASAPSVSISTASGAIVPTLAMPGVGNLPLNHFKFSVSTSPAEIEYAVNSLNASILAAQSSLEETRRQFDKEMYDYQDEETEKILGRIYIKLRELSIKEGVSVVVDKKSILFGHKAVDLTEKLIKDLKEDDR